MKIGLKLKLWKREFSVDNVDERGAVVDRQN